ncbi:enoyl-CoA hydratase [Microbacterium sp. 179-B 1A2 NHS]|uniref:enoyl-CoA hydratase n=1 Tax=Microbacterium sp. 179-B 1A2 NHS TaxID=3142383 RepID=UPI00399F6945
MSEAVATARALAERDERVLTLVLDNPGKRNALTWDMYEQLEAHLAAARTEPDLAVVVMRGGGEDGFAAGTDISGLTDLRSADDGIAYERRVGRVLDLLRSLPMPTIAAVRGPAVGAGLALAATCDLVVAERGAVFGAPIARTVGNCLPAAVVARVAARMGAATATGMLLTASLLRAEELTASGFVTRLAEPGRLDEALDSVVTGLLRSAPLTLRALTQTLQRLGDGAATPSNDDLLALCYGSADFAEGVDAFLAKRRPEWKGR